MIPISQKRGGVFVFQGFIKMKGDINHGRKEHEEGLK